MDAAMELRIDRLDEADANKAVRAILRAGDVRRVSYRNAGGTGGIVAAPEARTGEGTRSGDLRRSA